MLDRHCALFLPLHVRQKLSGHFLKDLLSEISTLHSLVEDDELDDIAFARLASRVPKATTIAIQRFHRAEVGIANADNDDRARHMRQVVDQVFSLGHVMNGTISQE